MPTLDVSTEWTALFNADGQWVYARLTHAPMDDASLNQDNPEERYPEVEIAQVLFLPEYLDQGPDSEYPYQATSGWFDVASVSYKDIKSLMHYTGRYERISDATPNALLCVSVKNDYLNGADRAFFTDRARWLGWANQTVTPDRYTFETLRELLACVIGWRQMGAYERAEVMFSYYGGDPAGYGDGCYETFAYACKALDIDRADCGDTDEWDAGEDIEEYGPYCDVCDERLYPRNKHSVAHHNYLEERAQYERERLAEQAMDARFDGD